MIPKVIHQIWIGPKECPIEWMKTWADKNPNLAHTWWDEEEITKLELVNQDKYKLFLYGGIYIDADAVCLQSIEEADFMQKDFFACREYDRRLANGVIGATPHHPIIKEYRQRITEATVIHPPCYTIGGTLLTSCVEWYFPFGDPTGVAILPSSFFYPHWKTRGEIEGPIYSRHMWGSTKGLYK